MHEPARARSHRAGRRPRQGAGARSAKAPFFEPGLDDLLAEQLKSGRLSFTDDPEALADCEAHFLCVGTPQKRNENAADLSYVDAAVATLLPHLRPGAVVIGKSTVPVGTAERLAGAVASTQPEATLVWNPEFLREGHAVEDTLRPDRLVFGLPDGDAGARGARAWRRSTETCSHSTPRSWSPT